MAKFRVKHTIVQEKVYDTEDFVNLNCIRDITIEKAFKLMVKDLQENPGNLVEYLDRFTIYSEIIPETQEIQIQINETMNLEDKVG